MPRCVQGVGTLAPQASGRRLVVAALAPELIQHGLGIATMSLVPVLAHSSRRRRAPTWASFGHHRNASRLREASQVRIASQKLPWPIACSKIDGFDMRTVTDQGAHLAEFGPPNGLPLSGVCISGLTLALESKRSTA